MRRPLSLIILVIALVLLLGCEETIVDNKLYPADRGANQKPVLVTGPPIATQGLDPFVTGLKTERLAQEDILITASHDGQVLYTMQPTKAPSMVIKGDLALPVRVFAVDVNTGARRVIIESMPFVSLAKWNPQGTILALGGSGVLKLWDGVNQRQLMKDTLSDSSTVVFFGWSPDGKRLFTEHPNLPNNQIIFVDTGERLHAYQTTEPMYFMGQLDEDHFIARYRVPMSEEQIKFGGGEKWETVITDREGRIVKSAIELNSRYRGTLGKSIISVGLGRFGVNYTKDINNPEQKSTPTGFVYDLKFVDGGKMAYITSSDQVERNEFVLRIVDLESAKTHEMAVSGSSLALHPDGKTAVVGGPGFETIDFGTNAIIAKREYTVDPEHEAMYRAVRGAIALYMAADFAQDVESTAKAYLTNSTNPEQWGLFDIVTFVKEQGRKDPRDTAKNLPAPQRYALTLTVNQPPKVMSTTPNRASLVVGAHFSSYYGSGAGRTFPVELIKQGNTWYVTGFSTFPSSQQVKDVRRVVEQTVSQAKAGIILSELQNKDVTIGQIQLWMLSEPHWSPNAEWANYAKAYLTVKEGNTETIYKLVLKKQNNTWQVQSLKKEALSGL